MDNSNGYWQRRALGRGGRRAALRATALGVAGLGAAWLAACGGGGSSDSSGSSGGDTSAGTAAAGVQPTSAAVNDKGEAKPGGTIVWANTGDAPLDIPTNPTYRAAQMEAHSYSRLVKFNTGPKPEIAFNYETIPDLATKWEVSGDGMQYTFKLNPDATFHNKPPVNGRAVTSEDVKVSMERFRTEPKNTSRGAFGTEQSPLVASVETPDPQTVVFKLAKPFAPFLNVLANSQYFYVKPREAGNGFDPSKDMIGSGPWIFDRMQPSVQATFKKNPNYFVKGRPNVDNVTMVVIPETSQGVAQFQAGRLSYYGVPAQSTEDVIRSNPKSQVLKYISNGTYTFLSPQQRGNSPFKDPRVRQAVSMAVDRKGWHALQYTEGLAYQNAIPASLGKWWLNPQSADAGPDARYWNFDARAARDLLKAAGQENLTFKYLFSRDSYGDVFIQGAEATSQMLKEAGFNPTLVPQTYLSEYIAATGTFYGNYEGMFYGYQTGFTDPHDFLFNMLHSKSTRNHAGVNDPRLDQMIDDEGSTLNEADRLKKVHDIQRYSMANMFYIPIATGYTYLFQQPEMRKMYYSATYAAGTESFLEAWIDKA